MLICGYVFNQIIPSKCRYEVLSTKIEIRLAKAESIPWKSLEFNKETTIAPKAIASSGNFRFIYSFPCCFLFGDFWEIVSFVKITDTIPIIAHTMQTNF